MSQHEFDISCAQATLFAAVDDAGKAKEGDEHQGSSSWNLYRYHTTRDAVASAVSAYQGSAATAASGLAAETGKLLAAHADYIAAIGRAQATRLSDEAAAEQSFWHAVATLRDDRAGP